MQPHMFVGCEVTGSPVDHTVTLRGANASTRPITLAVHGRADGAPPAVPGAGPSSIIAARHRGARAVARCRAGRRPSTPLNSPSADPPAHVRIPRRHRRQPSAAPVRGIAVRRVVGLGGSRRSRRSRGGGASLPRRRPGRSQDRRRRGPGPHWLEAQQSRRGSWSANEGRYPTAMTALAGTALLMEGSTTSQGRYAEPIRLAVDYLVSRSRTNGLIGDPEKRRPLHLRPRLLDALPLAGARRGGGRAAPRGARARAHEGGGSSRAAPRRRTAAGAT